MGLRYESLDKSVRTFMEAEFVRDRENDALYLSPRLTDYGTDRWPALLLDAIRTHDDEWLSGQLRRHGCIQEYEQRAKKGGGTITARVPSTAADTLAEGEFNRYYVRGLCASIAHAGGGLVEVYRGKEVAQPRPSSEAKVGHRLDAAQLLADLREAKGVEPALGVPPGPNSGLTVRRT